MMSIQNPLLIIGCPRSGTTLLYNVLSEIPDLWSIGYESKDIIEKYHHPREKGWSSGALDANDITNTSRDYIISQFINQSASGNFWAKVNSFRSILRKWRITKNIKARGKSNLTGSAISSTLPQSGLNIIRSYIKLRNTLLPFLMPEKIRLLEKTPENCLRLPFMIELLPDAKIIFLIRDARANIYSLMEGWQQPYIFPGYNVPEKVRIPGDIRGRWAFTLIPGWQKLLDQPLEVVCAWQWYQCNNAVVEFLESDEYRIPFMQIKYEDLINNTEQTMDEISDFLDISMSEIYQGDLPDINVVSQPGSSKWREKQEAIERVIPIIKPLMDKFDYRL